MQNASVTPPTQSPTELRAQIRQQVRQQVEAARAQAQIAQEEARAAHRQGEPVVVVRPPGTDPDYIPAQVVDITLAFFMTVAVCIIGFPIARAIGRRLGQKTAPPAIDSGIVDQLQRIEQTVDAMAIEVERISEAQRYMARLQTEQREPVALPSQENAS